MDKVASVSNLIHPQHTYITDGKTRPLHIFGQSINDPWLTTDGLHHLLKLLRDNIGEAGYEEEHRLAPCFDVRESKDYYFLKGEFAGVESHNEIEIEWVDDRTLLIEAKVQKLDPEAEWGISLRDAKYDPTNEEREEIHKRRDGGDGLHHNSTQLINERHTGHLRRSFTFQRQVDIENLKVRLRNGLLKIIVPKASQKPHEPRHKVNIEH
jgi:HSP20 family protein